MAAKKKDNDTSISESLANEARELGIEPSGYDTSDNLQARVDRVRAEKEAVQGDQPELTNDSTDEVTDDGVMSTNNTPSQSRDR